MQYTKKIINFFEKSEVKRVCLIFILSLIIRLFYLYNDYPFVFHPDEPTIVNSTINLRYNFNPKHFDWPTGYYYINYFFYGILEKTEVLLSILKIPHEYLPVNYNYFLVSRIVTIIFGSLSVIFTYLIVKNILNNNQMAEISAVIMALMPLHVYRSALVLNDVPLVFFSTLSIFYLTRNFIKDENKNYYLSCFFAGVAVSMKYNAYMVFLTIILYVFIISGFKFSEIKKYIVMAFVSIFGFFTGTPYAFFDYKTFLRDDGPAGALWQFKNVGSQDNIFNQIRYFFENLFINNLSDTGYLPIICSIFVGLYAFYLYVIRKDRSILNKITLIFFIQVLYIVWSVSGLKVQRSHYFILMYSFLPILSTILIYQFKKISSLFLIIFVISSLFPLLKYIESNPLSNFYNNITLEKTPSEYNFVYDSSRMKQVLDKMKVRSDKIDFNKISDFKSYTHALSNSSLCLDEGDCKFNLIHTYANTFSDGRLYLYEVKR